MRKKNKTRKRKISFFKILALLLLIASIFILYILYKVNILPNKYYYTIVIALGFINILFSSFLMRRKAKKGIRIFISFLSILVIGVICFASYYILHTLGFLSKIKNVNYKLENYSVIVLKDSKYEKIEDIDSLDVGYYGNSTGAADANKKILKKVDVTFKKYNDSTSLSEDLINDKTKVIVIEDSVLSMIKEENNEFESKTKVIYKFSIKIKSKAKAKDVDVTSKPFTIYVSGIDTYGKITSVSRSDVNMLITVNPETKQVLLTSIPRDYYVQLHGIRGNKDKLTHAGMYGVDMSISTIEDLLDVEINYYVKVNFTSLIDIVNALDGITVYSDYTFTSIDGMHYTEGNNFMNGEQALSFARERKAFAAGDRQRGKDQQAVIAAIIKKVCSKKIITKYSSLLKSLDGKFQTNMSQNKITSLLKMQLNDMASWNVSTYNLEGVDSREYTYSGGNMQLYVMLPVTGSLEQVKTLIDDVIAGKTLSSSYTYDGPINTVTTIKSNTEDNSEKNDKVEKTEEKKETKKDTKDYEYPKCKNPENGICLIETDDVEVEEPICNGELVEDNQRCSEELTCTKEFTLSNGKCIKNIMEKVSVCNDNYHYEKTGMVCCPDNYSYDSNLKACVAN